jgi:hypothetical protein
MVEICGLDSFGLAIGSFEHDKETLDSKHGGNLWAGFIWLSKWLF